MVEHLADLSAVESEVRVKEVGESYSSHSNEHPGIVSLASRVKRIVTEFVTIRQVVHVVFFLEGMSVGVTSEDVLMAI